MASSKNIMVLMFLVMIFSQKSNGKTYRVGDLIGWTNTCLFDYKTWAATKTFRVGDKILFEYKKQRHNVVRVTHKNFNSCNATAPHDTMHTGHDVFTIKKPGHFYFICGYPGHCESGQRVDIRVTEEPVPRPISTWSPAPTPTTSGTFSSYKGLLQCNLGLLVSALASVVVYGFGL